MVTQGEIVHKQKKTLFYTGNFSLILRRKTTEDEWQFCLGGV